MSRVSMLREPSNNTATSGRLDFFETCTHSGRNNVNASSEIKTKRKNSRRATATRRPERIQFARQTHPETAHKKIAASQVDHAAENDQWLMTQPPPPDAVSRRAAFPQSVAPAAKSTNLRPTKTAASRTKTAARFPPATDPRACRRRETL